MIDGGLRPVVGLTLLKFGHRGRPQPQSEDSDHDPEKGIDQHAD
jgi:hypothetical protein